MFRSFIFTLGAAVVLTLGASGVHASDVGVVFLHAKGSDPQSRHTSGLVERMRKEGMSVVMPEMPWSKSRGYDASYPDALAEVHRAVEALKQQGVNTVIVAGHSLGANGAIGYAAHYADVHGVAAIAPGHVPELNGFQKKLDGSVERARAMVADGREDESARFADINQGTRSTVKTTPSIYLTYFAPDGAAVIPANVMEMNESTALLWIVGEKDRMAGRGQSYAFSMAPANELNAYVVVKGGHKATPSKGEDEIIGWIKRVADARQSP